MTTKTGVVKTFVFALSCLALLAGAAAAGETDVPKPHMMYFYNPTCRLCTKTNETIAAMEEKYKDSLTHQRFNIADSKTGADNVMYMFDLLDEMKIPEDDAVTLAVFLGLLTEENGEVYFTPSRAIVEGENIINKLDKEIADFLSKEGKGGKTLGMLDRPASFFSHTALAAAPVEDDAPAARPRIRPRQQAEGEAGTAALDERDSSRAASRLKFGAVSLAALADSVNPCAFATIIILVAMMSSARRTKNEIIAVCLAFTASVFVTYFAIGLFLHRVISWINSNEGTSYWFRVTADLIYYVAFAICVVFALLSLWDAYRLFRGMKTEEMTLQLPKSFKKRINVAMAKGVRARWLVAGVFMAGVTVSFVEAACTGQVYLPTIIALAKMSFWESMALLLWYNFLFVVPLLLIFGLVLIGVTSAQLADFFKKNVAWIRVALAVVFIAMGTIIWFEMYWPPGYRG